MPRLTNVIAFGASEVFAKQRPTQLNKAHLNERVSITSGKTMNNTSQTEVRLAIHDTRNATVTTLTMRSCIVSGLALICPSLTQWAQMCLYVH